MRVFINDVGNYCFRDNNDQPVVPTGEALRLWYQRFNEVRKISDDQLMVAAADVALDVLQKHPALFLPLGPITATYMIGNNILRDIELERAAQNAEFGGASNDDENSEYDWDEYIMKFSNRSSSRSLLSSDRRQDLIKIAALAIAAIESFDRQTQNK